MDSDLKLELTVEQFSEVCRTCLSKNLLAPINAPFQDNTVKNLLKREIPDVDIEDKRLPQQICSICVYQLRNIHDFKLKCMNNEALFKSILNNFSVKTENITFEDEPLNGYLSNDELPLLARLKTEDVKPENNKQICEKDYFATQPLQVHTQKYCKVKSPVHYTCKFCIRAFKRQGSLNRHIKQHHTSDDGDKPPKLEYKCQICGKEFANHILLKKHGVMHGEKKFLCSDCGKGFVRKSDLQSHIKVHTGERPYVCQICEKTFAHSGSLLTHNLVHTGHKPFKCSICDKFFSQKSHLKTHQRTHSGERPYSCTLCGKTFALKTNFRIHTRTHTGETPYNCPVCGRGFHCSSSMKKHKNTHSIVGAG